MERLKKNARLQLESIGLRNLTRATIYDALTLNFVDSARQLHAAAQPDDAA